MRIKNKKSLDVGLKIEDLTQEHVREFVEILKKSVVERSISSTLKNPEEHKDLMKRHQETAERNATMVRKGGLHSSLVSGSMKEALLSGGKAMATGLSSSDKILILGGLKNALKEIMGRRVNSREIPDILNRLITLSSGIGDSDGLVLTAAAYFALNRGSTPK